MTLAYDNVAYHDRRGPIEYVAITTAGVHHGGAGGAGGRRSAAIGGLNEKGLGVVYAASGDLLDRSEMPPDAVRGDLCAYSLANFSTVPEFEAFLDETNERGRQHHGRVFALMDAEGNAAVYELGRHHYVKYDANDPETAPDGFIVRASFSLSGAGLGEPPTPAAARARPDEKLQRYFKAHRLWESAVQRNELDYRFVIRKVARDLSDPEGEPYPIPVEGTAGEIRPAHERTLGRDTPPPGTIPLAQHLIAARASVSVGVVHGVKPGEDPALSTFWAMLGHPLFTVAVPCWTRTRGTSAELWTPARSPICDVSLDMRWDNSYEHPPDSGLPPHPFVERYYLRTERLNDIWGIIYPAEDRIFDMTDEKLAEWREELPNPMQMRQFHEDVAWRALRALLFAADETGTASVDPEVLEQRRAFERMTDRERRVKQALDSGRRPNPVYWW